MKTLLTVDLDTKTAAETLPAYRFGETMKVAMRLQQTIGASVVEPEIDVDHLRAAIGAEDARPLSGTWALQIGNTATAPFMTAALPYNVTADALKAAINAKTSVVAAYGTATTVEVEDGVWRIIFTLSAVEGGAEVPLTVVKNKLWPVSFGHVDAYAVDGVWRQEVRLIQVPVALTADSERVLPDPPSITRVQAGGASGGTEWNEIQALFIPADFRGTFIIRQGVSARTEELDPDGSVETLQAALRTMIGGANVTAVKTRAGFVNLTFMGELAGTSQTLMTVEALNPPPGDLTFSLPLDRAELATYLRRNPEATLPLEVRLWVTEGETTRQIVAFTQEVTIERPLIWPELATVPAIDWLRPPSPRDYIPFSPDNIITGQRFYSDLVGDGAATSFVLDHPLDTDLVFVFGREAASPGRQLVQGMDFTVTGITSAAVTVNALTGAPALNAWRMTIIEAATVASFADGLTVTIGQVTGLRTELDAIEADVAALLALAPSTPLSSSAAGSGSVIEISIPDYSEVFPGAPAGVTIAGTPIAPKPLGGLLPALHVSTPGVLYALPLGDPTTGAGQVAQNGTGVPIVIPGGLRTKSSVLEVNGYFGCDGRRFYPVTQHAHSYFPRDFERELFMFEVNPQMLRAGTTLDLNFKVALALLQSRLTRAQYILVVEHGTVPSQTSPSPTSTNLSDIVWNATPLLTQRLILGGVEVTHPFGVEVIRAAGGTLTANKRLYNATLAADSVPASADFALRARLMNFDTENSVADPKGAVSIKLTAGRATIS